jgi:hypothetical protein
MKVVAEIFKGIEFIRISNLPEDQKEFITISIPKDRIIKILKDNVVLKDCVQYHDYIPLYNQYETASVVNSKKQQAVKRNASEFAFK